MKKLICLFFFGASVVSLRSQLLELDYRSPLKSESRFSIGFFKQFMLGATTLGHIDTTVELMNIKFNPSGALLAGFSVAGTQTFWVLGNLILGKQTISALRNAVLGRQTFRILRNPVLGTLIFLHNIT